VPWLIARYVLSYPKPINIHILKQMLITLTFELFVMGPGLSCAAQSKLYLVTFMDLTKKVKAAAPTIKSLCTWTAYKHMHEIKHVHILCVITCICIYLCVSCVYPLQYLNVWQILYDMHTIHADTYHAASIHSDMHISHLAISLQFINTYTVIHIQTDIHKIQTDACHTAHIHTHAHFTLGHFSAIHDWYIEIQADIT
jgi:hypothetical protein